MTEANDARAVRWSSPTNAWAMSALMISFAIPVVSILEIYQPLALEAISVLVADIWQWLLLIAAGISLAASLIMSTALGDGARMRAVVRVEEVATSVVAACLGLLWAALVAEYGFSANPLTQLLVGGLGLAAVARVAQIEWDVWKYRRALKTGAIAHVEAAARPKGT